MPFALFSATGCMRCKIVKSYMDENGIAYQEFDFKSDGKDEFNAFYRKNRPDIYRGKEGVEFPILYTENKVIQGVAMIIAFLKAEDRLNDFVTRSELSHGWVSGLNISNGQVFLCDDFLAVVAVLKSHGLKTQIETDGRNAEILSRLTEKSLVDLLTFNLKGPAGLYATLTGNPLDKEELELSLSLIEQCPEYKIILPLLPFWRTDKQKDFISPEEAAQAAAFVEQVTNKKTHPFYIKQYLLSNDEKETLPVPNLFKYRTACRRYMVKAEILK
jgi:pyruvate formate lyase activating enzyme